MTIQTAITDKLTKALNPTHLDVANESHMHNVPPGSESHFRVVIVSESFEGASLVKRHRSVNTVLAEDLKTNIHALALHTYTPAEYLKRQADTPASPECQG